MQQARGTTQAERRVILVREIEYRQSRQTMGSAIVRVFVGRVTHIGLRPEVTGLGWYGTIVCHFGKNKVPGSSILRTPLINFGFQVLESFSEKVLLTESYGLVKNQIAKLMSVTSVVIVGRLVIWVKNAVDCGTSKSSKSLTHL